MEQTVRQVALAIALLAGLTMACHSSVEVATKKGALEDTGASPDGGSRDQAEGKGREAAGKVKDPSAVVVDEVAGQWLVLLAAPVTWQGYLFGFVVFRVVDILKPWPASWARSALSTERLTRPEVIDAPHHFREAAQRREGTPQQEQVGYDERRDFYRANQEQLNSENPVLGYGSEFAGAVAVPQHQAARQHPARRGELAAPGHPGRPGPHGESHAGSPGLVPFQSAKSSGSSLCSPGSRSSREPATMSSSERLASLP